MRITDTSVPVVILKVADYGALGVMRSLGRLGIAVYAVNADSNAPGFRSRYCSGEFIWDVEGAPAEVSVGFLLELARKIGGCPMLIPTGDVPNAFVAEHTDVLKQAFIFAVPPPELIRSLGNKKEMYFLCRKLGFPTARTAFPQSKEDVLNFLGTVTFPIMLKAIDSWLLQQRTGVRMVIVENKEKLFENYERLEDPQHSNLMLQEYIPGGEDSVWMFGGYFNHRSDCLFGLTGKKIRQSPAYTGSCSLGICLKNEVVETTVKDFMKAVGYRGILDIGLRYDARYGQYKILDVNPRIGSNFRLFVAPNGMDVVRALYLDLTGQSVPPAVLPEGRKWLVEDQDLISSLRYHRDGKLTFKQWVGSFRGTQEAAYFAWDDPAPFVKPLGNLAQYFYWWVRKRK